jgi:hypothetical protein
MFTPDALCIWGDSVSPPLPARMGKQGAVHQKITMTLVNSQLRDFVVKWLPLDE